MLDIQDTSICDIVNLFNIISTRLKFINSLDLVFNDEPKPIANLSNNTLLPIDEAYEFSQSTNYATVNTKNYFITTVENN